MIVIVYETTRANVGQVLSAASPSSTNRGETIFDTLMCQSRSPRPEAHKEFSGIDWNDIDPRNSARAFSQVEAHLDQLLQDCILIGHGGPTDLKTIFMDLPSHTLRLRGVARRRTPIPFDTALHGTKKCSSYPRADSQELGARGTGLSD